MEGEEVVAVTGVGSVEINDDIGILSCLNEELHEEPAGPAVEASRRVQVCNLVVLVHSYHVPAKRSKGRVPGGRAFMQNCVKKAGSSLTWCTQTQDVHRGGSPRVAQGLRSFHMMAQRSPQHLNLSWERSVSLLPRSFGVVPAAWHVDACCQNCQFVLQQVEECNTVVKMIHEQPWFLLVSSEFSVSILSKIGVTF